MTQPTGSRVARNVTEIQELYAAFRHGGVGGMLAKISPDVEWGEPANPFNPAAINAGARRQR